MPLRPLARVALAAVLAFPPVGAVGCGPLFQPTATVEAQQASLVQDAIAVNRTVRAAYQAVHRAYRTGLISPERRIEIGPYIRAAESGAAELTRAAQAGEADRYRAVALTVNAALAELATVQVEASAAADKKSVAKPAPKPPVAAAPAPIDDAPTP